MEEKNKKFSKNPFVQYTGLGLQLFVTIYLFHWLGTLIDEKIGNKDALFSKLMIVAGVIFSMVSLILQLKKMEKNEK
jgi:preprotein translocase subunit SecY